jgi:chromate reductase
MRVLAILGSLGKASRNLLLVDRVVPSADLEVERCTTLGELPFFDPDIEPEDAPAVVLALRAAIARADAVLIACPEYGHSLPGVLKNAIDWVIGTGELERKVVAITASVPHLDRGRRGLAALAQTLGAVSAEIVWDEPILRGTEDAMLPQVIAALKTAVDRRPPR